jgi:head-tail adaptor
MLRSLLNLHSTVQIRRIVETSDGMGGTTTSTTLTTLAYASIWQPSGSDTLISDKITQISTHVLALESGEYAFTTDDREVIYDGHTYTITGHADDVANRGTLVIVGLKWLT